MDAGVRGSFGDLAELKASIARLASHGHRLEMSALLAETARTQVVRGFQRGVDPYDAKWKPVLRGGQPLRDTGRLQNSIAGAGRARVTEYGFTISTGVRYAAVHQYGATIKAKNAPVRFGGVGSSSADMVSEGKPMLRFKIGRGKKGRWVSKRQVTIPRRQFMPEGTTGPRWNAAMLEQADAFIRRRLGVT